VQVRTTILLAALLLASSARAQEEAEEQADPTVELFAAKCASCHTVGKGARVGPDLARAHERRDRAWLKQMIQTPSRLLSRDATARQLLLEFKNVRMPDLGMSEEQAEALIELIVRCSAQPCDLAGKFVPITEATEEDFARGEALFVGHERTKNGSVSCIACHNVAGIDSFVSGGTLGVDLTHVFARLGDEGMDAALKNPPFPLMNKVFTDHPLEPEEAFALRAFLYEANRGTAEASDNASLPLFGVLGAVLVLVILNAFWSRRLRGVRKELTQ
jgi:mono/diheme cytochrome c family protein